MLTDVATEPDLPRAHYGDTPDEQVRLFLDLVARYGLNVERSDEGGCQRYDCYVETPRTLVCLTYLHTRGETFGDVHSRLDGQIEHLKTFPELNRALESASKSRNACG